jgi:prevent-host-death family protein
MTRIPIAEARGGMSDVLNRVVYQNEQFALTRHGQTVAVVLSVKDARAAGLKVDDEGTAAGKPPRNPATKRKR